jgi:mono/diheme cytochrome c family protein
MRKRALILWFLVGATVVLAFLGLRMVRHGFSARDNPSAVEAYVARSVRRMAIPASARDAKNPFTATTEMLSEARTHFADHCAICHANDGSGATEIGRNLYPKTPDMRLPQTQNLSDGEIYYIIHNGIRLTGMPAWGQAQKDDDSWKLVLFIRHLTQMSPEEMKEMEQFNPKSAKDRSEEEDEERFLNERKTPKMNMKMHYPKKGEQK